MNLKKKIFNLGFAKGVNSKKKTVNKKSVKKSINVLTDDSARLQDLSMAYATHMGRKYNLTESEVRANAKSHYLKAKRDPVFRQKLINEYEG